MSPATNSIKRSFNQMVVRKTNLSLSDQVQCLVTFRSSLQEVP